MFIYFTCLRYCTERRVVLLTAKQTGIMYINVVCKQISTVYIRWIYKLVKKNSNHSNIVGSCVTGVKISFHY